MSDMTLRDAVDDLRMFTDTLEGLEEGSEEHDAALQQFAADITQGRQKIDRFAGYIRLLRADQTYMAKEADRLENRIAALQKREARLLKYAIWVLTAAGERKVTGQTSTLSLRKNNDSVEIINEEAIPASFQVVRTVTTIDKRLIRDAIKSGEEVPGAVMKPGGDRLDIA